MYAIQGAMAIRRQRQIRENRRTSQGKGSSKGQTSGSRRPSESGSHQTIGQNNLLDTGALKPPHPEPKSDTSQTAFYIGVVFILLGFLMIFSSLISNSAKESDWSRILGVGVTFLIVGLIMVMVNRIISAREEEELSRYVSHRLGRSRSGHTLVRDAESGEDFHHQCTLQKSVKLTPNSKTPRPSSVGPLKSPRDKPRTFLHHSTPTEKSKPQEESNNESPNFQKEAVNENEISMRPVTKNPHQHRTFQKSSNKDTNSNNQSDNNQVPVRQLSFSNHTIKSPVEEQTSMKSQQKEVEPDHPQRRNVSPDFYMEVISETETLLKSKLVS